MKYHSIIHTGVLLVQGLVYVKGQSSVTDCSDPAGMSPVIELLSIGMILVNH